MAADRARTPDDRRAIRAALLLPLGRYDSERAAQLAGIPRRTLNYWFQKGLYVPDLPDGHLWTYRDLVYVRLLAWLSSKGDLSIRHLADKVAHVKARLEDPHEKFIAVASQGAELLAKGEYIDQESGELVIHAVADMFSEHELTLDSGNVGRSQRWWPDLLHPAAHLVIRPDVLAGEPCLERSRISTAGLYALHEERGLTPTKIARLYPERTPSEIESAIEFETRLHATAA